MKSAKLAKSAIGEICNYEIQLQKNWRNLQLVNWRTAEICKLAKSANWRNLQIGEQIKEICNS
jgi:hypothetical protein